MAGPRAAQRLARHSDINLTMNTYTQLGVDREAGPPILPWLRPELGTVSNDTLSEAHLPLVDGQEIPEGAMRCARRSAPPRAFSAQRQRAEAASNWSV